MSTDAPIAPAPFITTIEQLDALDDYAACIKHRCEVIWHVLEEDEQCNIPLRDAQMNLLLDVAKAVEGIRHLSDEWAKQLRRAEGLPDLPEPPSRPSIVANGRVR